MTITDKLRAVDAAATRMSGESPRPRTTTLLDVLRPDPVRSWRIDSPARRRKRRVVAAVVAAVVIILWRVL